jgi:hypothetical protein
MHTEPHVKYPLIFSDLNETLISSTQFPRIRTKEFSRRNVSWEASGSMRAEGRTELFAILLKRLIINIETKIYVMAKISLSINVSY